MPFSSGTFSRIYNWVNEQLSSPIEIAKLDEQEQDFATALSNCILRDGTGLPTAAQDWNGQNLTNVAAFTATGIVTGGRFVPTSSSAPTNGMYLSAANTLAFASNSTLRWSVNSNGAHVFAAATSGSTLRTPDAYIGLLGGTNNPRVEIEATEANGNVEIDFTGSVATGTASIKRFNTSVIDISANRNVTIGAPSSGVALTLTGFAGARIFDMTGGTASDAIMSLSAAAVRSWTFKVLNSGGSFVLNDLTRGADVLTASSTGNVTIAAPSIGTTLSVGVVSAAAALSVGKLSFGDDYSLGAGANVRAGTDAMNVGTSGAASTILFTNGQQRQIINSAGNVTINAPSSGTALSITAVSGGLPLSMTDGTVTASATFAGSVLTLGPTSNHGFDFRTNNITRLSISSGGGVAINNPTSGTGLTVAGGGADITGTVTATTFSGSGASLTSLPAGNLTGTVASARISGSYTGITAIGASCTVDGVTVGYRSVPRSTTTTTAATTDVGKCIAASAGITIPNATFAAGDCLSIYNDSASSITITQGASLTLRLAGTTTTGNLTLQPRGMATIWFNTASEAIASGSGLG